MIISFDIDALLHQLLYDEKNPLLFNSGFFVYMFAAFILLYYLFRNHLEQRTILFCFFSLYFFYKASGFFVILVVIAALADFLLSNLIYLQTKATQKKALLTFSIILNLSILIYFKYTNFFLELANNHFHANIQPLNLLLPIGISFYTFENISYTVDVYRGKIKPVKDFSEYLLFLSFFPKLVMGPIVRAADFIPQIKQPYFVSKDDCYQGFYLILSGLFKKLIIADFISLNFVDYIFDAPAKYTGLECLFATYGYAMVIYCDFSGYSSVAIGLARWLGYKIPPNFLSPYQSQDITDFWKRWHISLSTWLRDYIYIPLGGNRNGAARTYLHLMITMLLGGLWHGANTTFLIWGALHGFALCVHKLWSKKTHLLLSLIRKKAWYQFLCNTLTFHFVCLCWIVFKAADFTTALTILKQIKYHFGWQAIAPFIDNYYSVLMVMLLGYFLHTLPEKFTDTIAKKLSNLGTIGLAFSFILFILLYGYLKSGDPVQPIYLQF